MYELTHINFGLNTILRWCHKVIILVQYLQEIMERLLCGVCSVCIKRDVLLEHFSQFLAWVLVVFHGLKLDVHWINRFILLRKFVNKLLKKVFSSFRGINCDISTFRILNDQGFSICYKTLIEVLCSLSFVKRDLFLGDRLKKFLDLRVVFFCVLDILDNQISNGVPAFAKSYRLLANLRNNLKRFLERLHLMQLVTMVLIQMEMFHLRRDM